MAEKRSIPNERRDNTKPPNYCDLPSSGVRKIFRSLQGSRINSRTKPNPGRLGLKNKLDADLLLTVTVIDGNQRCIGQ